MDFYEKFGKNLKELREQNNMTQMELSNATGISQSKLSRWEAGINLPSLQDILKLSDYYGLSVNEIARLD